MTAEDKRLAMLENLTATGKADAFAWYALALEYRRRERTAEALVTFERLRSEHTEYLPTYLMCGQMLIDAARGPEARPWLELGVDLARRQGNGKTLGELEAALADCDAG